MIKLELPDQEKELQKWHSIMTAAIAPVFLKHYLSRVSDYANQVDDFAKQMQGITYDPNLSDQEKLLKLNTIDHRVILTVNAAIAHQTFLMTNALLQKAFPEIFAQAAAQSAAAQAAMSRTTEPDTLVPSSSIIGGVSVTVGKPNDGQDQ